MVGLWTMVADLRIKHPGRPLGLLVGDEIDYWADLGSVEEHVVATEAVLAHTRTRRALAILSKEEADWAPGIPVLMTAVGAPGEVKLPLSARLFGADYGLTGRPGLQVYTHDRTEA
jgi:hypothetical protein